jgi:prepilin-type N-terminal cleavage/methylation domain-containing protein
MRSAGFTLVEVMISVAIFALLMGALMTSLVTGRAAWEASQNGLEVQAQARSALWVLSKDLRQAGVTLDVAQSPTSVAITFSHPADGAVTYTWVKDPVTGLGDVTRLTASRTRIIARNISAFSVTNNGTDVLINVTATHMSATKKLDSMSLSQKVVMR